MSSIPSYKKALAIVPKVTGSLSFFGSIYIFQDIIRDESKRKSIFHRIMLGLSIFDTIASGVNFLSTWPSPSELSDTTFLASGTTATCTAQGFFNEFGNITTPLYSASLCVWYLLFLKYGWKEKDCRKYELFFHIIPIAVGLTMAVLGLPLTLYNNSGYLCWYAPFPKDCDKKDPHTCTRGEHAGLFRWVHYGIIWTSIAFVTYAMSSIYFAVRRQEGKAIRRMSILSNTSRKKSKAVAAQAALYVCALYLTWLFTTCTRISQTAFDNPDVENVFLMLMAFFFPLQGFWNALIYKRPQWLHNRKRRNQSRKSYQQSQRSSGSNPPPISRLSFPKKSKGDKVSMVSFAGNSSPLSTHTKYSMGSASQNYHDEEGGANDLNGSKCQLAITDGSYKSQLDDTVIMDQTDVNEDEAKNNIPQEQAPEIDPVVKTTDEEDPEAGNTIHPEVNPVSNHEEEDDSVTEEEIFDYQVPLK